MSIQQELRDAVQKLRRTPVKLADFIPLLQRAADKLDALENERKVSVTNLVGWPFPKDSSEHLKNRAAIQEALKDGVPENWFDNRHPYR